MVKLIKKKIHEKIGDTSYTFNDVKNIERDLYSMAKSIGVTVFRFTKFPLSDYGYRMRVEFSANGYNIATVGIVIYFYENYKPVELEYYDRSGERDFKQYDNFSEMLHYLQKALKDELEWL